MPVIMTWNTMSEKNPAHGQSIIWLQVTSAFDSYGFQPRELTVEYQWSEFDEQGYDTGVALCYEEGDKPLPGHRLVILADGWEMSETDLWMDVNDYYTFLETHIPALRG